LKNGLPRFGKVFFEEGWQESKISVNFLDFKEISLLLWTGNTGIETRRIPVQNVSQIVSQKYGFPLIISAKQ
jgi:hypothetical protein